MEKVIKRDGRKELFNKEKIVRAVELSFEDVEKEISEKAHQKALEIANYISAFEKHLPWNSLYILPIVFLIINSLFLPYFLVHSNISFIITESD